MQQFLWLNRPALEPHLAILMLRHLKPVAQLCMAFSRDYNILRLADLAETLDAVLAENKISPADDDPRDILLSCEGLSGHLPGWPNVDTYAAAPVTVAYVAGYFAEHFPDAEIMVVYTTREPNDWLHSAWRHHLIGQRMTQDWDDFSDTYAPSCNHAEIIQQTAEGIEPLQLFTLPLEDGLQHPKGPGGALLELLDIPEDLRSALAAVGHANLGPDAQTSATLLELNRSSLPDKTVAQEKTAMVRELGIGGWVRPDNGA